VLDVNRQRVEYSAFVLSVSGKVSAKTGVAFAADLRLSKGSSGSAQFSLARLPC
jgi:type II secretory pathway component GspD/PulD (secretin)